MKNLMIPALALFLSAAAQADDSPLWMRYCAISPDGQTIAFSYQGDIYTVPSSGGKARQLTTHPVHRGPEQAGPHLRRGPLAGAEHCRTEECPAAGPENALRRSWRSLL